MTAPPTPPPGRADGARLQTALATLQQALDGQGRAIRRHRVALSELEDRIARLDRSCADYRAALDRIDVGPLRRASLRLADIMDGWLSEQGPPYEAERAA